MPLSSNRYYAFTSSLTPETIRNQALAEINPIREHHFRRAGRLALRSRIPFFGFALAACDLIDSEHQPTSGRVNSIALLLRGRFPPNR